MRIYCVPDEVLIYRHGGQFIFLKVDSDDFLGLPIESVAEVTRFIHGWPGVAPGPTLSAPSSDQLGVLDELAQAGLIIEVDRPPEPRIDKNPQSTAVLEPIPGSWWAIAQHPGRVCAFVRAYLTVRQWQNHPSPTRQAILAIRRFRQLHRQTDHSNVTMSQLVELVATARWLQPWVMKRRQNCFVWSQVLGEYLRHMGIDTDWIVGVRADHFAAHSWVQHNSIVLDGCLEELQAYIPAVVQ